MGRNIVETIVGALVLVVAGVFVFYAFAKSDHTGPDGYEITARFGRIDGLKRGADVTIRAKLPGDYERPDEFVECTPLEYAMRFGGASDRKTVKLVARAGGTSVTS